jgi:hypothetical protein
MYNNEFVKQQTAMLEVELLKVKAAHGSEYADRFLDGASLFVGEVLPLIFLKANNNDNLAAAMVDGVKYIATHTQWLLELQSKDWTNAKG